MSQSGYIRVEPKQRLRECRKVCREVLGLGRLKALKHSGVQSVYRYTLGAQIFVVRWDDIMQNYLYAPSAEREVLLALERIKFNRVPRFIFEVHLGSSKITGLTFLPGKAQQGAPVQRQIIQVAEFLGYLHFEIEDLRLASGTAWNTSRWRRGLEEVDRFVAQTSPARRQRDEILDQLQKLETHCKIDSKQWGIVHSDPNWCNWIFYNGSAGLIDFAESGPSFYLWDLAVLLTDLWCMYPDLIEQFGVEIIRRYESCRRTAVDLWQLYLLMQTRVLDMYAWSLPSMGYNIAQCQAQVERADLYLLKLKDSPPRWLLG